MNPSYHFRMLHYRHCQKVLHTVRDRGEMLKLLPFAAPDNPFKFVGGNFYFHQLGKIIRPLAHWVHFSRFHPCKLLIVFLWYLYHTLLLYTYLNTWAFGLCKSSPPTPAHRAMNAYEYPAFSSSAMAMSSNHYSGPKWRWSWRSRSIRECARVDRMMETCKH